MLGWVCRERLDVHDSCAAGRQPAAFRRHMLLLLLLHQHFTYTRKK
jgi:hypothetical protein